MGFFSAQNQISESYGNRKTTLENGGRNPPDVTLDDIAKDLLSYFNKFEYLRQTKRNIEEKYDIKNEYGDCWSAGDIKRAWGKTQRMAKKSDRRKHWARVITLQMLNRLVYDRCKQNTAQENHDHTTDETKHSCEKKTIIKVNKDDNSCEQQKITDNHEKLNFTDMPNQLKAERENGGGEDDLWSAPDTNQASGKAEIMKGNSEDRSSQSTANLETVEAAGEARQSSGGNRKSSKTNQTNRASTKLSGAQFPAGSQATRNDPGAPAEQSGTDVSAAESDEAEDDTEDETSPYIRIPLSEILLNEQRHRERVEPTDVNFPYKLINGLPSNTDIRKRKSYTMSFNHQTNNAEWVYEILNRETLEDNCLKLKSFGADYHKGHLAAAANHRWCREARSDTYLFSNIVPQHKKLNLGRWKSLEYRCRKLAKNQNCNVHVYTGPLYLTETNDDYIPVPNPSEINRIEGKVIPTHLFKVIIVENEDGKVIEPECYVVTNKDPRNPEYNVYKMNILQFQRVSGLTFIENIPKREMRSYTKSGTLQGEGGNGQRRGVNIRVRINS